MNPAVMCFDIGGSFIKSAVLHADDTLQPTGSVAMPARDWSAFCLALQQQLGAAAGLLTVDSPVAVSAAGVVDSRQDTILAGNIPAFAGHQVSTELCRRLGRRVIIGNDADCFTLAEATSGAGEGADSVLGIILGSGVGGGLVINRQLITGAGGLTGEWGHGPITRTHFEYQGQSIDLPRLACGCGQQGCLDTFGAARGVERLWQHLYSHPADSKQIVTDWLAGDARARQVITLWSELVSEVLAVVVNTLGPDRIVAGGGLAGVPALLTLLDEQLRRRILRTTTQPLVVAGQHQQQGGLLGAGWLGRTLT